MKTRKIRLFALAAALMLVFFSFTSCQSADSGQKGYFVEYEINAAQLYIDGKKISDAEYRALNAAAGELIRSIEREISVEFPDSDLSEINAAGAYEPVAVGEHTYRMLELCGELHSLTAGKFSPALYNLSEIWGFSPDCEGKYNVSRSSLLSCRSKSRLQAAIFPIWSWTGSGCRRTLRSNSVWAALPRIHERLSARAF
ncbi:MAG: FAD:protein FMN transferase [Candidatus Borkfalkia sp.]